MTGDDFCLVEGSWGGAQQFWNSTVRGPDCFNAAGASFYVPIALMRARLAAADAPGSPIISSDGPADGS